MEAGARDMTYEFIDIQVLSLEKRKSKDRRNQTDRRKQKDPVLRIVGDERRKAMRDLL